MPTGHQYSSLSSLLRVFPSSEMKFSSWNVLGLPRGRGTVKNERIETWIHSQVLVTYLERTLAKHSISTDSSNASYLDMITVIFFLNLPSTIVSWTKDHSCWCQCHWCLYILASFCWSLPVAQLSWPARVNFYIFSSTFLTTYIKTSKSCFRLCGEATPRSDLSGAKMPLEHVLDTQQPV